MNSLCTLLSTSRYYVECDTTNAMQRVKVRKLVHFDLKGEKGYERNYLFIPLFSKTNYEVAISIDIFYVYPLFWDYNPDSEISSCLHDILSFLGERCK